jgi:hypothetical protein
VRNSRKREKKMPMTEGKAKEKRLSTFSLLMGLAKWKQAFPGNL